MIRAYEVITDRVISLIEAGAVPWHRPWSGPEGHPKNLASGKQYRGVNVFMLSAAGYESPYWLSYKQAKDRGGHVKKGEKGYPCVYWNWYERKDKETEDIQRAPFLKYYTVFNVAQCEGVDYPSTKAPEHVVEPIRACEQVVSGMPRPPSIVHDGSRASYEPSTDSVNMPDRQRFENPETYYGTLFHELVHSTGHKSRLCRPGLTDVIIFGSRQYSKEELIAEMGATFLCGHCGIENAVIDNSAAYIDSWLRRLKGDSKLVVHAAARSQKAVDFILDRKWEESEGSD